MDSNIQIQTIKSQIENMKLQIDNISMQNNMLMMNAPIGDQLINLSIQILNTGIQTFNIGKALMMNMNMDNYYEQLKKVSEQINTMINDYSMQQQQIMMLQQMMMQQQMMVKQQFPRINVKFNNRGMISLIHFKIGTKVKEALKQYIERYYGIQNNKKLIFLFNGKIINQNELEAVEKYFFSDFADIRVNEI